MTPNSYCRSVLSRLLPVLGLALSLCAFNPFMQAADTLRIRVGTVVPSGTSYHKVLQSLAGTWNKAAEGRVKVGVYPDGTLGGEAAMVDALRINTMQAGLLSAVGLSKAVPQVQGLQSIPLMFRSDEEIEYVNARMGERMERLLEEKGLEVLFWADAGWVYFFTTKPVVTPDDLRALKVFTWSGDAGVEKIFRGMGFNPVPLETGEIATGLKTGLIEAVPMPPFVASASRIYQDAPHVLDLKWAPLVGAFVVNRETWGAIPPDLQERFRKSAENAGALIRRFGRAEASQTLKVLEERGSIRVHHPTPALVEQWRTETREAYPLVKEHLVPEPLFNEVEAHLKAFRAK